jgi:hypothetical protein
MNVREPIEWRKSTRSDHQGGDCVEVASATDDIMVRDSKDPCGPRLTFSRTTFRAFTQNIRSKPYDLS